MATATVPALRMALDTAPQITPDQMALITRTVAQGATPDELNLYLHDCARQGVHPLDRLIHFTVRKDQKTGQRKYTPITSIDYMRIRAADSGEMAGSDDPVFDGPPSALIAATVTVYRMTQGQRFAYTATARWTEYKPSEDFMWRKMPHTMLGKCAEALALRKGFPKQLAGLYAREEMEQADAAPGLVIEAPKTVAAVNTDTGEVLDTVPLDATPKTEPGAPYHWIVRCEDHLGRAGKKKAKITFTDGTAATIWNPGEQLFAVCVDLMQKVARVVPKLQHKEGYAPTLKGITRYEGDEGAQEPSREQPPDVAPPVAVDEKSIPF